MTTKKTTAQLMIENAVHESIDKLMVKMAIERIERHIDFLAEQAERHIHSQRQINERQAMGRVRRFIDDTIYDITNVLEWLMLPGIFLLTLIVFSLPVMGASYLLLGGFEWLLITVVGFISALAFWGGASDAGANKNDVMEGLIRVGILWGILLIVVIISA